MINSTINNNICLSERKSNMVVKSLVLESDCLQVQTPSLLLITNMTLRYCSVMVPITSFPWLLAQGQWSRNESRYIPFARLLLTSSEGIFLFNVTTCWRTIVIPPFFQMWELQPGVVMSLAQGYMAAAWCGRSLNTGLSDAKWLVILLNPIICYLY